MDLKVFVVYMVNILEFITHSNSVVRNLTIIFLKFFLYCENETFKL